MEHCEYRNAESWHQALFNPNLVEAIVSSCQLPLLCLVGGTVFLLSGDSERTSGAILPAALNKIRAFANASVVLVATLRLSILFVLAGETSSQTSEEVALAAQAAAWILAAILSSAERDDYASPRAKLRRRLLIAFYSTSFGLETVLLFSFTLRLECPPFGNLMQSFDAKIELIFFAIQYVGCITALLFAAIAPWWTRLVNFLSLEAEPEDEGAEVSEEKLRQKKIKALGFKRTIEKFRQLWQFAWPKDNRALQLRMLVCLGCLMIGRITNVFTPIVNKWIVNSLSGDGRTLTFEWRLILLHFALRFAQTQIRAARAVLWQPIHNSMSLEVEMKLYEHIQKLPLSWHLSRKTGQVLSVVNRGKGSVDSLLSNILFEILPTISDTGLAVAYFISAFRNRWFLVITITTMIIYSTATMYFTALRNKHSRKVNKGGDKASSMSVDSLLNFETVKYFTAEEHEVQRYRELLKSRTDSQWTLRVIHQLLSYVHSLISQLAVLACSLLCAFMVVTGEDGFTVGDYSLFATFVMTLISPLDRLSEVYKAVQTSLIDMESMMELLATESEIRDPVDGREFQPKDGLIEFRNVSFHYKSEKPVLKNVSFTVEPGKTLALVGATGSGKSTICRLLFRFYDPVSGVVLFDGQDISKVTQTSFRRCVGVVPQDTVLFNETIRYNIRYGKFDSTDDEVERAAEAAEIHEHIMAFPQGYNTMVGERGLRLSGGEKQRVAIARTILKGAKFILLDEATSSLDSNTERLIQASLDEVSRGRTTVVIAHRLSTIVNADEIVVLKEGEIVERGRHQDLIALRGLYTSMWEHQLKKAELDRA